MCARTEQRSSARGNYSVDHLISFSSPSISPLLFLFLRHLFTFFLFSCIACFPSVLRPVGPSFPLSFPSSFLLSSLFLLYPFSLPLAEFEHSHRDNLSTPAVTLTAVGEVRASMRYVGQYSFEAIRLTTLVARILAR